MVPLGSTAPAMATQLDCQIREMRQLAGQTGHLSRIGLRATHASSRRKTRPLPAFFSHILSTLKQLAFQSPSSLV